MVESPYTCMPHLCGMDNITHLQQLAKAYIDAVYSEDSKRINDTRVDFDIWAKRWAKQTLRNAQPMLEKSDTLYSYSTNGHLGYRMGKMTIEQHNAHLHDFHAAYVYFSKSVGLPYFIFEQVQARIAADAATNAFKY
jgi:hypothetical protein